jgi:hypothetical protein
MSAPHAGSSPPPCVAIDDQATASHRSSGLAADFAFDQDLALCHVLPDLIEAIRAALDPNVPRVTATHPKDVTDRDPLPPGLQFEPRNLADRPPR